uniref:DUF1521 domain-containing protein n=1 Tax=Parastrongyloides trichosuri TaxID=131310 RepID=A0A0N4ZB19_PARTI
MGVYSFDQAGSTSTNNDLLPIDSTTALTGKDAENCLSTKANNDGSITCRLYKLTNNSHVFLNINNSRFIAKTEHSKDDDIKHALSSYVLARCSKKNI